MRVSHLLLAALALAFWGCRSESAPAPAASAAAAEVPAPASLLAELSLGNPKETWKRLRGLGGVAAAAFPSSLPVLLTTSLSLPASAVGSLDETLPMVGVLLSRPEGEPDAVLGMHVVNGAELTASLSLGGSAKFKSKQLAPGLMQLEPALGQPTFNGALGVSGNYLLLATRVGALSAAGRFVAETLPRRATKEPGLALRCPEGVLSGSLPRALREAWQARRLALAARDQVDRKAKGRAPDFADPHVLLAGADAVVESWLDVLASSTQLNFYVTPEADRMRLELTLVPASDGAASLLSREVVVGSLLPLLSLPERTRVALSFRGDEKPESNAAGGVGASLAQLFGERLTPEQAARMVKAFDGLRHTQRGASVVGFVSEPTPAVLFTFELSDPDAYPGRVADVLALLELPPVVAWLSNAWGRPKLELSAKPASGPRRARLRFSSGAGPAATSPLPLPRELSLAWEARAGVGYGVISTAPDPGLRVFLDQGRLSSSEWLNHAQKRLGDRTALSVFVDARWLGAPGPEMAPALFTFGKDGERILISLEAAPAALSSLSRLFALDSSP